MYELVIYSGIKHKNGVLEKLNALIQNHDTPNATISSFDGASDTYFYIDVTDKKTAEDLIQYITKLKHVEGAYIKPKGTAPSN